MWYWINVNVFNRLVQRLKLLYEKKREDAVMLLRLVFLTSNIDELLKTSHTKLLYDADPGGTGSKTVHTVPDGKRQIFYNFHVIRSVGSTLTISAIYYQVSGEDSVRMHIVSATNETLKEFSQPLALEEGSIVQIFVAAHTAGDEMQVTSAYIEEDAFEK